MNTNKIDLIKAEVARIQLYTQSEILKQILDYIDEVQKEPVKIKKGCKYRCLSDMVNKDTGNISFIGDKIYLAPKDNTLVTEENGWLCDTSENASNFELIEEPVSDEIGDYDHKAVMEALHPELKEDNVSTSIDFEQELYKNFGQVKDFTLAVKIAKKFYEMGKLSNVESNVKNWKEEPISEDWECKDNSEELNEAARQIVPKVLSCEATAFYTEDDIVLSDEEECFKAGARWQKQHSKCPLDCPAFSDGYKIGMKEAKQQMIKDAFECKVKVDAGGYPYIPQMELYDYDKDIPLAKEGDKYKVILIKED